MKIVNAHNTYSYILNELEWYGPGEASRQSTIEACKHGAREAGCEFAAILVEPDAALSISPHPTRHRVWANQPGKPNHSVTLSAFIDENTYAAADPGDKVELVARAETSLQDIFKFVPTYVKEVDWAVFAGTALLGEGKYRG